MSATPAPAREWTDPTCPVARTIDLVGDRWSLLIVRDAMDGATAFTEFQQRLGIARNILADRLRKLVEHGILVPATAPGGKRHTYELTTAGRDLFTTVVALRQWGERHAFRDGESHSTLVDATNTPLPELRPETLAGTPATSDTTRVRKVGAD
ncbi:winged helix-turn-helix transcriptional regulator [Nocardia crassostreae]|uniref:winged helix-turn-helix transcriptional regulator n=1 Tax=Nocardia crassostreae TaxID=53428 RepID=UPI000B31520C|nr:helix-turn-helix domain-containing protein [Nocardia crassostreae]